MTVEVSVGDVRAALMQAAGSSAIGSGEAATLLLGRVFHEVFADLVSPDEHKSALPIIIQGAEEREARRRQLSDHTWQRLVAPRLLRHGAELQASSESVLMLWSATRNLLGWLESVVTELDAGAALPRGSWERLARMLQSEVPLTCELREPSWAEPVRLVGIADSILHLPEQPGKPPSYCAIELKLGRCRPVIDLGQVALYHLILSRSDCDKHGRDNHSAKDTPRSALALMRFSPNLDEQLVERAALAEAERRLLDLVGKLAGVARPAAPAKPSNGKGKARPKGAEPPSSSSNAAPPSAQVPPSAPEKPEYLELSKRLIRAYKEQGVGIELRGAPLVGPRFLRFDVRLTAGGRVDALKRRTPEVQHRLELATEPLIIQEAGHLYIDLQRPDPATIEFGAVVSQLPALDARFGAARIPVGVDAGGRLHSVDLASAGRSHVLAAGTTGSGKSEWLRMMMAGLIATNTPDTLRFVTFDPKLAAFADLERSKFLWKPASWWIPGTGRPASEVFEDLMEEMDRRYQLTRQSGADNLREHVEKTGAPLARIVCVCDEYFALVSQNKEEKKTIEEAVSLLGAKARAAGIHLVLATQQPSRQIIHGAIQANLPCRVALTLQSHIESNMILNAAGAERLTGKGDLLYKDFGNPVRLQAPLLTAADRERWLRA
jgi:energy-coupling factor transporter ATP-binding protein EcfA2